MKRRLYFLVPDPRIAHTIVDELLLAHVEDRHLHVLAREGVPLENLHEASLLERSDLKEATTHGFALGGGVGFLAGLIAIHFPPAGVVLGGGMVAATALAGAGFGAWVSGMIGISAPNRELKAFQAAVDRGKLLMMVDVPAERVREIRDLVRKHHSEVDFGGVEPHLPVFP